MRIIVHAVGRMKSGPEKELAARYFDRFAAAGQPLGLTLSPVIEIAESPAREAAQRKAQEAEKPLALKKAGALLVLLDEQGKSIDSAAFATMIARNRDGGIRDMVFAIGGPDGHGKAMRDGADAVISFGAMTWPHQIARIMLAEQLYRAATILAGHPYHRV